MISRTSRLSMLSRSLSFCRLLGRASLGPLIDANAHEEDECEQQDAAHRRRSLLQEPLLFSLASLATMLAVPP
jgi:hypothetical protein